MDFKKALSFKITSIIASGVQWYLNVNVVDIFWLFGNIERIWISYNLRPTGMHSSACYITVSE